MPPKISGSGRPIDADLSFWGACVEKLTSPKSRMPEIRANVVFGITTLLFIYGAWCVYDRFRGTLPSIITSATVINSPVQPGSRIEVRIDLMRRRICERDFEYLVMDRTGHRERFQEAHMHGIGNPGPDSFIQSFQLPARMEPGPGRLRLVWSWQCPENLYETIYPVTFIPPDIKFEIAKPPP